MRILGCLTIMLCLACSGIAEDRLWRNKEGKTILAELIDYDAKAKILTLRKDGKTYQVKRETLQLDTDDQDHIEKVRNSIYGDGSNSVIPVSRLKLGRMVRLGKYLPSYDLKSIKEHWEAYSTDAKTKKDTARWILIYMDAMKKNDPAWRDELLSYFLNGSTWRDQNNSSYVFRNSVRNLNKKDRAAGAWANQWEVQGGKVKFPYQRASFTDDYQKLLNTPKGELRLIAVGL